MKYDCNTNIWLKATFTWGPELGEDGAAPLSFIILITSRALGLRLTGRNTNETLRALRQTLGGTTHSSPNVISMQMKGTGIRRSRRRVPLVAMETEISSHQSGVGHEADKPRAKRMGGGRLTETPLKEKLILVRLLIKNKNSLLMHLYHFTSPIVKHHQVFSCSVIKPVNICVIFLFNLFHVKDSVPPLFAYFLFCLVTSPGSLCQICSISRLPVPSLALWSWLLGVLSLNSFHS